MRQLDFKFNGRVWSLGDRPRIMGVINVTPDSFSDGGTYRAPESALARAREMVDEGADLLDIGGESTRPGAAEVPVSEEIDRVVPVIEAVAREVAVPVSVDTRKSAVAKAALQAGAAIVNDVSGLTYDPGMADLLAATDAGLILMHMRGTPETMQELTSYDDLIGEIRGFFQATMDQACYRGIQMERICLDPGIGFGKTAAQNLHILRCIPRLRGLERPLLLGVSRKSFIGRVLDIPEPRERAWGTAGAVAVSVFLGADIVRVHDVAEMRQAALIAAAIRDGWE